MIVWQNGHLLSEEEVSISPFDTGLTVGEGAFETMRAEHGAILEWRRHEKRFLETVARLGLPMPDLTEVESGMKEVVLSNSVCRELARVRLTYTGGGNLLVTAQPLEKPPMEVTAVTLSHQVDEQCSTAGMKTLSYASHLAALAEAQKSGADEGIRANRSGDLCEGCVSNVFFVKKGVLHTPSLETGCLPGIMRDLILEKESKTKSGTWPLEILTEVDEIWLCNSLRRLQWVKQLDDRMLGEPSSRFLKLRQALPS